MANASVERFKKLTQELQKECLQIAHEELGVQAERLVGIMKNACPVNADPPPRPGLLRDSIGWTFGSPPKTKATGAFRPQGSGNFIASVYAGNDEAFYARWVEFGTQSHSLTKGADISRKKRQGGTQHPGSVAQPFFWPSYRLMRKTIKSTIRRKLTAAIKKRSAE